MLKIVKLYLLPNAKGEKKILRLSSSLYFDIKINYDSTVDLFSFALRKS